MLVTGNDQLLHDLRPPDVKTLGGRKGRDLGLQEVLIFTYDDSTLDANPCSSLSAFAHV